MAEPRLSGDEKENATHIEDEVRLTAELIFDFLYREGETDLEVLREKVTYKVPFFDWGVGWLLGKGDLEIFNREGILRVRRTPPAPVLFPLRGN